LSDRIHSKATKKEASEKQQRLSPGEEDALKAYILQLQGWGWPARVEHVHAMATELLRKKGVSKPLGINWVQKYIKRYPELKSKYVPPLDKERASAEDSYIIGEWLEPYARTIKEYNIQLEDNYNMDEKGFMMGVIQKLRVIVLKHKSVRNRPRLASVMLIGVLLTRRLKLGKEEGGRGTAIDM